MPSLQQLRYLVAIAETRHFRRAAEACHVTQPTLSGQLRELERKLGIELVERGRSGVVLSPLGAAIAARARAVLREVEAIEEMARLGQDLFAGTLRVGVLQSLGPYLLPHILPDLHRRHRDLKVYVREGMPRTLLDGLGDGSLDLLFFPLPVRDDDLAVAPLFREPLLLAVPAEHALAGRDRAQRRDLKGETVLTLEPGHRLHDQVRELCQSLGASLSPDYEGTSLDTLRQMVGLGMGLSFLPALYVRSIARHDRQIALLSLTASPPVRQIGMLWRRRSARGPEFAELAATIREIAGRRLGKVIDLD